MSASENPLHNPEDTLSLKPVNGEGPERDLLLQLYSESFPENEWRPDSVEVIQNAAPIGWKAAEWLIMDGNETIGLLCVVHTETYAYLLYLAVSSCCQGKGYGSRTLELFKRMFPNHIRFFDLEVPDESAENARQRTARIRFYERNGYHRTDYSFESEGVALTIMTDSDNFAMTGELAEFAAALEPLR